MARKSSVEFQSAIDKLIGAMEKNKIEFLEELGKDMEAEAKRKVRKRTGELEKSINHKVIPWKSKLSIGTRAEQGKTDPAGWRAHFEEFGTIKMKRRQFMKPAAFKYVRGMRKRAAGIAKFSFKTKG